MQDPFIHYLTVFNSRLGIANIVLPMCGLAHQSSATLSRKTRKVLEARVPLDLEDAGNDRIFQFLIDKGMIGKSLRKRGRYKDYTLSREDDRWRATYRRKSDVEKLTVFDTDVWMSAAEVPSTIGVPTPDNTDDVLSLIYHLGLLSPTRNTLRPSGQTAQILRRHFASNHVEPDNPFLIGVEVVALFRQVLEFDGIITRELVRRIVELSRSTFTRDEIAQEFLVIVRRAVEVLRARDLPVASLRRAREFMALIERSSEKSSSGPGVLEHRVSPRLEWLVDLGYLHKDGLAKNGFEYHKATADLESVLKDMDRLFEAPNWPESVSISQWNSQSRWDSYRRQLVRAEPVAAFRTAYEMLKRPIGPSSIKEVVFVAALYCGKDSSFAELTEQLISFANSTEGVSLSGGRYQRSPENIHMTSKALGQK